MDRPLLRGLHGVRARDRQLPFADTDAPMAILLRHINEPAAAKRVRRSTRACRTGSPPAGQGPGARPPSAAEAGSRSRSRARARGPALAPQRRPAAIDGGGEVPGPFTPPPSTAVPNASVFTTFDPPASALGDAAPDGARRRRAAGTVRAAASAGARAPALRPRRAVRSGGRTPRDRGGTPLPGPRPPRPRVGRHTAARPPAMTRLPVRPGRRCRRTTAGAPRRRLRPPAR